MNEMITPISRQWWQAGIAALLALLAVIVVLWPTSESFVQVWAGGQTYNHGFVILPITLWLIWQKRKELAKVSPLPSWWPLAMMALSIAGWLVAYLVGVQVVAQAAFVTALLSFVTALLGWRIAVFLAFPLLFLYFGVPVGDALIPPLMNFTASFTVEAIRLTGIPVYRQGFWFTLPNGSWSVVEACSGLRYIIASVTLGFLYSYLSYHTLWKRLAFIALCAVVPVLANGIRAYLIVMIGYLSNMELAVGIDHLIYGWVFFGLVMLLLFWIGNFWQEDHPPIKQVAGDSNPARLIGLRVSLIFVVGLALLVAGAALAWRGSQYPHFEGKLQMPKAQGNWHQVGGESLLHPTYLADTRYIVRQNYSDGKHKVSLFATIYPHQRQGYEVVAKRNAVVGNERGVQQVHPIGEFSNQSPELPAHVYQWRLTLKRQAFSEEDALVWRWYRIAGRDVSNAYLAKAWEAWARIFEGRSDGEWIAVATPILHDRKAAREVLENFLKANYPAIRKSFEQFVKPE